MAHALIRTIDRWRFERPLALVLGLAAAFAAWAVSPELLGGAFAAPPGRLAGAVAIGLILGVLGYIAMRRPSPPRDTEADPIDEEPEVPVPAERLVRLRRADAHPDAPPRQPIHASRDLGEPFMDVGAFVPPPAPESASPIVDADFIEVEHFEAVIAEEPIEEVVDEPEQQAQAEPETAPEPEAEPEPVSAPPAPFTPAPHAHAASLGELMDRLSAGLERRGGKPPRPPAQHPQLREALDELNRLASRRD
ncbi:MAG TPA: hypothetical protein VFL92_09380 [Sphingomonas sp.]|nr:hypothetical protein [Sphingomonas sp.]